MNYNELAKQLLSQMKVLHRAKHQQQISGAMHGRGFMLWYLANQTGEIVPSQLSDEMNLSSARVAQALNKLEEHGWICREIDPEDRRRILIKVTEEGRELATAHYIHLVKQTGQMLELLGEDDAREYVRITTKLAVAMANQPDELSDTNRSKND